MSTSLEQTIDTIHAMRRQEETGYSVVDYLSCLSESSANTALDTPVDTPVDASCRLVMAKWCNEIADFCSYKRETVAIAMNCVDRFVSTPSGQEILFDRNQYQLAIVTALYSSIKMHEHEVMNPQLVSKLCRGVHSPQSVEAMESKLLMALQWRVNPPTAMSFVRAMIDSVPDHLLQSRQKGTVLEVARLQIERIVNEYHFCTATASSIALACALNAMESVTDDVVSYADFETTMMNTIMVDVSCIQDLRTDIYELMNCSNYDETKTNAIRRNNYSCKGNYSIVKTISPRTVATSVSQRMHRMIIA